MGFIGNISEGGYSRKITVCPPFNASMTLMLPQKTQYNCAKKNLRVKKIRVNLTLITPVLYLGPFDCYITNHLHPYTLSKNCIAGKILNTIDNTKLAAMNEILRCAPRYAHTFSCRGMPFFVSTVRNILNCSITH